LKLEDERRGKGVVAAHGFALQNDGSGNEAWEGRVPRGDSFAFRGFRSGAFKCVGAIGFYLTFRCHSDPRVKRRRGGRGGLKTAKDSAEKGFAWGGGGERDTDDEDRDIAVVLEGGVRVNQENRIGQDAFLRGSVCRSRRSGAASTKNENLSHGLASGFLLN
jgi:hypothetical protein